LRDRKLLQLGRQTEAVEEAEEQHGGLRVGLESDATEAAEVLEGLVNDGQSDDRVDDIGIDVQATQHSQQQGRAVPDREERHIECDVFEAIKEEDDPGQEQ